MTESYSDGYCGDVSVDDCMQRENDDEEDRKEKAMSEEHEEQCNCQKCLGREIVRLEGELKATTRQLENPIVCGMTVVEIERMRNVCHMKFGWNPGDIPFSYAASVKHLQEIAELKEEVARLRSAIGWMPCLCAAVRDGSGETTIQTCRRCNALKGTTKTK